MHNHNLPVPADPNTYALQQPLAPEVVPPVYAQYVPNLDGYSSVCVHVREASFMASNDPIACQHQDAPRALPLIDGGSAMPPVMPPTAPPLAPGKGKSRLRLTAGHVALWMCVGQLGIIIWLLAGQSLHMDKAIAGVKETISAVVGPKLVSMWHTAAAVSDDPADLVGSGKPAGGKNKRSKGKGSRGKKQPAAKSGGGFSWPLANNFVPPPPPEISDSKMMVPPPPVAYSLYDKAPGAVAASTLPPPPAIKKIAEPAANVPPVKELAAVKEPVKEPAAAKEPVTTKDSAAPNTAIAAARPAAAPPTSAASPPATVVSAPLPGLQLEPTISAMPSMPIMQSRPVMHYSAPPAPTPPTRTVMYGNRKRIITDR